jgi:hypothetical protein
MVLNLFRKKSEPAPEASIPVEPAAVTPAQLTPTERETQGGSQQVEPLQFAESRAPTPRAATARSTVVPSQVGAARQLRQLRRSNALRQRKTGRPSPAKGSTRRQPAKGKARPAPKRSGATGRKTNTATRTSARKAR